MRYELLSFIILAIILLLFCFTIYYRRKKAIRLVSSMDMEQKITALNNALSTFGFTYHAKWDCIISLMDPWQRKVGYSKQYDEAAQAINMIIDCEPIYFSYDGKSWLLEFWKGQYGCTTGAEIGLYYHDSTESLRPESSLSESPLSESSLSETPLSESSLSETPLSESTLPETPLPVNAPSKAPSPEDYFYTCAPDDKRLPMKFSLWKNNRKILERSAPHWWLTGFLPGEYSKPADLAMKIRIRFPNADMKNAFYQGLLNAGYHEEEIHRARGYISFLFQKPKTKQPALSYPFRFLPNQMNRLYCSLYKKASNPFQSNLDRITFLGYCFPWLYKKLIRLGMHNRKKSD